MRQRRAWQRRHDVADVIAEAAAATPRRRPARPGQCGERRGGRLCRTAWRFDGERQRARPVQIGQHRRGRRRDGLGVHGACRMRPGVVDQPHLVDGARLRRRHVVHHQHAGVLLAGEHHRRGAAAGMSPETVRTSGAAKICSAVDTVGAGRSASPTPSAPRPITTAAAAARIVARQGLGFRPQRDNRGGGAFRRARDRAVSSAARQRWRPRSRPWFRARRGPRRRTPARRRVARRRDVGRCRRVRPRASRAARTASRGRSGRLSAGHATPKTSAQAADGVAHPRLDRREVGRQPLGHLDVGQAVVVRELDALSLRVGQ